MSELTPMMQQYMTIKNDHPNAILFYRLGDFYEMFFDDALTASRELDIALTARDCGLPEKAPMCGVPAHAAEGYITKLIEKGLRVAVCDQVEDAKNAKGLVKREVVRIITAGTVTDPHFLDDSKHNYIIAIHKARNFTLAAADVTTGLFFGMSFSSEARLADEITRLRPAEIIVPEGFQLTNAVHEMSGIKPFVTPVWTFHPTNGYKFLLAHFKTAHLESFGIKESSPLIPVLGGLIHYLSDTQKGALAQITSVKIHSSKNLMALDRASVRNLELTSSTNEGTKKGSLLWILDHTRTAMGARRLRSWVEQPLIRLNDINKRLFSVDEWKQMPIEREELREYLGKIRDLERIIGRITNRNSSARDLVNLRTSLSYLPLVARLLVYQSSELNVEIKNNYDDLKDIFEKLQILTESPPHGTKEGGMITNGVNSTLDELKSINENSESVLADIEQRERTETGINSLKVRFNRVFGYYIEVSHTHKDKIPGHYIRKQTLANAERFFTDELKTLEETILNAKTQIEELEYTIFEELRNEISNEIIRIQYAAEVIATLDALQSLAEAAELNSYVKPVLNESDKIIITNGRHPIVEKMAKSAFVPNDTLIDSKNPVSIITGPNMAGKSTYMRQTALIVLMAQIGSFVPADYAEIGIVDRIFTRVGASDDLASGQSTFMVEMTEAAYILNSATNKSLILLDELGRGTSTYDGMSIAWAVIEFIADKESCGAKTFFATHYHELTELANKISGIKNYCFTINEGTNEMVFTRKLVEGAAEKSYGIHVAKLAGLPEKVINRAGEILEEIESG